MSVLSKRERDASVHRAISLLIEVEEELEGISCEHEATAARLRHDLYSLLNLTCRDTGRPAVDPGVDFDPAAVDEVLRQFGDGTCCDVFEPLVGDGSVDPTTFGDSPDQVGLPPYQ